MWKHIVSAIKREHRFNGLTWASARENGTGHDKTGPGIKN